MAAGNVPDSDMLEREQRLKREQRRLEINVNIGIPKVVFLNELDTRSLLTRSTQFHCQQYPLDLVLPSLERLDRVDKLVDDEECDVESLNSVRNRTCKINMSVLS